MHILFLCVFVVALFSSQICASGYKNTQTRATLSNSPVLTKQYDPLVNDSCNCQAARNDYTFRNPTVARDGIDPTYHYQNVQTNQSEVWNCYLCSDINRPPLLLTNETACSCTQANTRYTDDYGVTISMWEDYQANWNTTGRWWHCELCVLDYSSTCIEARTTYATTYSEVDDIDEVFHYITYGYPEGLTWDPNPCKIGSPSFPTDSNVYNCSPAAAVYKYYHPDIWGYPSPYQHYLTFYFVIGWNWVFSSCTASTDVLTSPLEDCWFARFIYWSIYPEAYNLQMDPVYHYSVFWQSEDVQWPAYSCAIPGAIYEWQTNICTCEQAVELYNSTYHPDLTLQILPGSDLPTRAYNHWSIFGLKLGHPWHCELCPDLVQPLYANPVHLLAQETCIAARNDYATRTGIVDQYDPVWHFENIGHSQQLFWDSSLCQPSKSPAYLTDNWCANCSAAKTAYADRYPAASLYNDPYEHWRAFYLNYTDTTDQLGFIFPCADYCNSTSTMISTPSPTPTPVVTPAPVTPTTTSLLFSTTTIGGITTSGSTVPPATGSSTATPSPSPSPSPSANPSVTASPTTSGAPTTNRPTGTTTNSNIKNNSSDSHNNDKLSTTVIIAIVVPIVAVLSVGLGMLFIHQQRRKAVQALIKAEEGERRNYKIDFMSLSVDWLIGSGSFGHVYRGEYRGADVAIKKLKKQNMGNQQLEDFAKEAMVMVGLRHPNIVLFMGVCLERPELCIVTEYMPRGNLYDVLHDNAIKLPFSMLRNMAMHVVKGLQFIHSAGMIHRDLKSPNLLVDANWTIKIADFGLSCAKTQATDDVQISLLWTAPEILMREPGCYSEKSDVYSLGIIFWELMSRQTPFTDFTAAAIPPVIVLGKRPPVQPDWNPTFKVLIAQCWDPRPTHRPLVREVRTTLESISYDSGDSMSNASPSVHSSISSGIQVELSERERFPPRGNVTLVFTDVEHSAELWEADPQTMLVALRLHNETCRKLLHENNGYHAQSEGDASMLAFSDPISAINYCVATQVALMKVSWPEALLKLKGAQEIWSDSGVCIYRGLRVRMGVHCGEPHCEQDQISYRTEYFGPVVNIASRVASHAVGGQIIATGDVYQRISSSSVKLEPCIAEQLGTAQIKGAPESVVLYQVLPKDLKLRSAQLVDLTVHNESPVAESQNEDTNSSHNSSEYAWSLRHNEKWIINYDDLELEAIIGTGSFGDVFAGTWKGQRVAIKQFMKQKVTDEVLLEMRTESGILSAIQHPNIIRFLGMCIKIPHLCLVTELLDRGSLSTILLGNEALTWVQRKNFAADIAKGLDYLHKNNIIHRDVKSPNMLIAADWTVKIADFGFSRVKSDNHTMTQCGTVAWTAPEIFLGERYSEKADVYSYSVILWELIFRKKPWQGLNSMKVCHSVENGERLPTQSPPSGTPDFIMKLMEACWLQDHERRPSFTEVLHYLDQHS